MTEMLILLTEECTVAISLFITYGKQSCRRFTAAGLQFTFYVIHAFSDS